MVWSLALCPNDTKQDSVVYGAEFGVVFLAKGPRTASNLGECCTLRYRIDITRANQKPLLHIITRTNHLAHLAIFDIVINLRRA